MTRIRSGIFSPLFESADGYLKFIHLGTAGTIRAVALVVKCCRASETPHREVDKLLDETDWRPHLVAAVALSMLDYDDRSMRKLWAAVDARSWVTPQLAVAAYLKDPQFSESARVRIQARCPIIQPISMNSSELQTSVEPAGFPWRSAKAAASLVRLVGLLPVAPEWLATELSSLDLTDLLSKDDDWSGEIAEDWLATLTTMLRSLNVDLV